MCLHSLPLILRLPAALGGGITLIQACIFRSQFEVLLESEWAEMIMSLAMQGMSLPVQKR